MGKFSRIHYHISKEDLKRVHEQKVRAKKLESERIEEERKEIKAEFEQLKFNWRKDISESDFTNITKGNTISQTFQHISGATITLDNTMSDTSEIPTQVTLDLGFGEKITVDAPSQNQFGITGVTRRLGITTSESGTGGGGGETVFDKVKELDQKVMQRQSAKTADQINQQLDASEKASGAETAKVQVDGEKSDDELEKLKGILDEKTKKVEKLNKRIAELNKLAAQQSKKISKMRDDGLKKIDEKYNQRNKVRDDMVRKFEASFPSLTYNAMGNMVIKDKADSDRYYKTEGDFYKKVDATWDSMTKKIDAERKAFLEKMDKLYNSTVGKYNQEEFNLTQYELPTAEAQYDEALKNHSDKLLDKNQLNQEQNMLQGMIDEVTSMFAAYFRQQLGGGLPLPVELTLRYAMGNMDPLTKSPGTLYNAITMKSIVNAFNMKSNTVAPHHYHSMDERIVQAAYNNFSYQITPNGIRVMDTFNFDDPDTGGTTIGAFKVIPGAQWLATQLVKAGDRNARSKGIDPRDDRFGIKVDYTIPKSDMTPEQIKLFYGSKTKSKTINKIKSMSKERAARKALSLDEPIATSSKSKRKNKKA